MKNVTNWQTERITLSIEIPVTSRFLPERVFENHKQTQKCL